MRVYRGAKKQARPNDRANLTRCGAYIQVEVKNNDCLRFGEANLANSGPFKYWCREARPAPCHSVKTEYPTRPIPCRAMNQEK